MAVKLGAGVIAVNLDDNTKAGLNKIEKNASSVSDKLGKKFDALGKVMVAAFAGTVVLNAIKTLGTAALSLAGDLNDMSQALDISAENLGALTYAGTKAGVGMEKLQNIFLTLNDKLQDAKKGSKEAQDAFNKMGITITPEINVEDVFSELLKLGNSGKLTEETFAALSDIIGKKLALQIKKLSGEVSSFTEAAAIAKKESASFSKESMDKLAQLGDRWDAMKMSMAISFGEGFMKAFESTGQGFDSLAKSFAQTAKDFGIVVGALANLITWLQGDVEKGSEEVKTFGDVAGEAALSLWVFNTAGNALSNTSKVISMANKTATASSKAAATSHVADAAKISKAAESSAKATTKAAEKVAEVNKASTESTIHTATRQVTQFGAIIQSVNFNTSKTIADISRKLAGEPSYKVLQQNVAIARSELTAANKELAHLGKLKQVDAAKEIAAMTNANNAYNKLIEARKIRDISKATHFTNIYKGLTKITSALEKLLSPLQKLFTILNKIKVVGAILRKAGWIAAAVAIFDFIKGWIEYDSAIKGAAMATLKFLEILDYLGIAFGFTPFENWINKLDKEWKQYADNQDIAAKNSERTAEALRIQNQSVRELASGFDIVNKEMIAATDNMSIYSDKLPAAALSIDDMASREGLFLLLKQKDDVEKTAKKLEDDNNNANKTASTRADWELTRAELLAKQRKEIEQQNKLYENQKWVNEELIRLGITKLEDLDAEVKLLEEIADAFNDNTEEFTYYIKARNEVYSPAFIDAMTKYNDAVKAGMDAKTIEAYANAVHKVLLEGNQLEKVYTRANVAILELMDNMGKLADEPITVITPDISGGSSMPEMAKTPKQNMQSVIDDMIKLKNETKLAKDTFDEFVKSGKYAADELKKIAQLLNLDESVTQTETKFTGFLKKVNKSLSKVFNETFNAVASTVGDVLQLGVDLFDMKLQTVIDKLSKLRENWESEKSLYEQYKLQETDAFKERKKHFEEEEKAKQKAAKKLWQQQKSFSVGLALVQAYLGASNAYTSTMQLPAPLNMILAPINAAIALAAGLMNVAKIKAQPAPKFRSGGWVNGSPYRDGTPILAMGGEYVVNRNAAEANKNALEFMNRGGVSNNNNAGINVVIQGDVIGTNEFVENKLIPAFNNAYRRGVQMKFAY